VSEPAVTVNNVSKKFRLFKENNRTLKSTVMRGRRVVGEDFWAVRDVSFDVPKGSTFGLIGRNGSGKSTLLKCLAKILSPNEGSIEYNGRLAAMLEVGSGFHPELTGRENVYLNGSILGLSRKEVAARFDEIVDFSEIGDFIDQPVKNYSSGMYVRLGFSVAITVRPDILVVDEVLAVGDSAFQRKSQDKFNELRDGGRTVILVTHSMANIRRMCDQVAWIDKGQLVHAGSVDEVAPAYEDFMKSR
jgi:lipopolysaccharide transport system ATP-binding protein